MTSHADWDDTAGPNSLDSAIEDVLASDKFREWLEQLPSLDLDDGKRLYLPTGDVPQDKRELAVEWLDRRNS